jgi:rod shape determining protein RodA
MKRQAVLVGLSLLALLLGAFLDYRDMVNISPWIYGGTIALLALVLFVGEDVSGARRWINLGLFPLQPSEIAKVAIVLLGAKLLSRSEDPPETLWDFALYYGWLLPPLFLIMKQPDLGTSLVLIAVSTGMLYFSGTSGTKIVKLGLFVLLGLVLLLVLNRYAGLPLPLEEYQIKRFTTLFNPDEDPLGTGYQVLQSKIAIGSGMLWGKGLGRGTQNRLDFIPEQHTDFIFSVVGEELGFLKTLLVLGLYVLILSRCLIACVNASDKEGTVVAAGILSMFLFHLVVNLGMTMGIMPVTGVPLPFLSYGGSALLVNSFAVGLVLNVGWNRHKIFF